MSLISHTPDPAVAAGVANRDRPQLSADGAWAVFESLAPDHVPNDLDSLDGTGRLAITPFVAGGGTVHLIVDVSGWFE